MLVRSHCSLLLVRGHHESVTLLRPITKGFEDTDLGYLIAEEKVKLEAYHEQATNFKQSAKANETTTLSAKLKAVNQRKLAEIEKEEDIVVREAVEVSGEKKAEAAKLKNKGNKAYQAKDYALSVEAIAAAPADPVLYSNRCAAH